MTGTRARGGGRACCAFLIRRHGRWCSRDAQNGGAGHGASRSCSNGDGVAEFEGIGERRRRRGRSGDELVALRLLAVISEKWDPKRVFESFGWEAKVRPLHFD